MTVSPIQWLTKLRPRKGCRVVSGASVLLLAFLIALSFCLLSYPVLSVSIYCPLLSVKLLACSVSSVFSHSTAVNSEYAGVHIFSLSHKLLALSQLYSLLCALYHCSKYTRSSMHRPSIQKTQVPPSRGATAEADAT